MIWYQTIELTSDFHTRLLALETILEFSRRLRSSNRGAKDLRHASRSQKSEIGRFCPDGLNVSLLPRRAAGTRNFGDPLWRRMTAAILWTRLSAGRESVSCDKRKRECERSQGGSWDLEGAVDDSVGIYFESEDVRLDGIISFGTLITWAERAPWAIEVRLNFSHSAPHVGDGIQETQSHVPASSTTVTESAICGVSHQALRVTGVMYGEVVFAVKYFRRGKRCNFPNRCRVDAGSPPLEKDRSVCRVRTSGFANRPTNHIGEGHNKPVGLPGRKIPIAGCDGDCNTSDGRPSQFSVSSLQTKHTRLGTLGSNY